MTFEEFRASLVHRPRDQRRGQYAFNLLHQCRPDLSEQIRADVFLDPFYRDELLDGFLGWVRENW